MSEPHQIIEALRDVIEVLVNARSKTSGKEPLEQCDARVKQLVDLIEVVTKTACLPTITHQENKKP